MIKRVLVSSLINNREIAKSPDADSVRNRSLVFSNSSVERETPECSSKQKRKKKAQETKLPPLSAETDLTLNSSFLPGRFPRYSNGVSGRETH